MQVFTGNKNYARTSCAFLSGFKIQYKPIMITVIAGYRRIKYVKTHGPPRYLCGEKEKEKKNQTISRGGHHVRLFHVLARILRGGGDPCGVPDTHPQTLSHLPLNGFPIFS